MTRIQTIGRWLAAPTLLGASLTVAADGEIQQVCNCNRGGGGAMPLMPVTDYMPPVMPAAPMGAPLGMPMAAMPLDPGPASPPPGTLGRTYTLQTRLIPAEKHPRVGMLDIRTSAEEVYVSHTNEFREEDDINGFRDEMDPGLWHFESKPLLQGIPHVYKIELVNGGVTTNVQYVRLIRGRIIELSL